MSARRGWVAAVLVCVGCASTGGSASSSLSSSSSPPSAPSTSTPASSPPSATSTSTSTQASSLTTGRAGSALWLQSLQMSTAGTGWALYDSGNPSSATFSPVLLARTTDGARTWTDVTPAAARPMLSNVNATEVLDAAGAGRAYLAVTDSRQDPSAVGTVRVFATGDGGRTWTESAPVKVAGYASQLSFTDSGRGWLLISEGAAMGRNPVRVYRTTDGGTHWTLTAQSPPVESNSSAGIPVGCDKTGIAFASATAGWLSSACAAGLSGELLVSRDGGITWGPQALPVPSGMCGDSGCELTGPVFTGGAGFLTVGSTASSPALLVSRDLGQTWRTLPLPAGSGVYPQVRFFDPRLGVLVPGGPQGSIGSVFFTTSDGGQTWTPVRQGMRFAQLGAAIDFVSPRAGFAWILGGDARGGSPPAMHETTDSGRTWTAFTPRLAG